MIDDMMIRNMSPLTQKAYIRAVKNFSMHFGKSPDKLSFEDVRAYQLHLIARGLQAATIIPIMCAIRFFFGTTLGRHNVAEHIPLARRADTLPAVLTRDQVVSFFEGSLRS
jgi:integrase/recombinase XerD